MTDSPDARLRNALSTQRALALLDDSARAAEQRRTQELITSECR